MYFKQISLLLILAVVSLALAAVATEDAKKTVYYYHPGPANKASVVKVVLGSTDPNVDNHYSVGG